MEETINNPQVTIDYNLYKKLRILGIIHDSKDEVDIRSFNVGNSNYSKHIIQPWAIWIDYPELTSWDHDVIKRILRTKQGESRIMDYEKIIHDLQERIRQLKLIQEYDSQS